MVSVFRCGAADVHGCQLFGCLLSLLRGAAATLLSATLEPLLECRCGALVRACVISLLIRDLADRTRQQPSVLHCHLALGIALYRASSTHGHYGAGLQVFRALPHPVREQVHPWWQGQGWCLFETESRDRLFTRWQRQKGRLGAVVVGCTW